MDRVTVFRMSAVILYKKLLLKISYVMAERLLKKLGGKLFKNLQTLYAFDVLFRQANFSPGNVTDPRLYYNAKRKLHRYKMKTSVLPNVLYLTSFGHAKKRESTTFQPSFVKYSSTKH